MSQDFGAIFKTLRALYAAHAARCVVLDDAPSRYFLGTHEVRARDGYRTAFGGVEIRKAYVSAHLMPVYAHPDMLAAVSPELKRRMQGKSCFNFKTADAVLFDELDRLITAGVSRFAEDGRL